MPGSEQELTSGLLAQVDGLIHIFKRTDHPFSERERVFGLEEFRDGQEKVIKTVLVERRDCLVVAQTGSEKSLCYQLPAVIDVSQVTIVVQPTIALIVDQVTKLVAKGHTRLLFVTPERQMRMKLVYALYTRRRIARFVFNEVHRTVT